MYCSLKNVSWSVSPSCGGFYAQCKNCNRGFKSQSGANKHIAHVQACKDYYISIGENIPVSGENGEDRRKTYYKKNREKARQKNKE